MKTINLKNILLLATAFVLMLGLLGCSNDNITPEENDYPPDSALELNGNEPEPEPNGYEPEEPYTEPNENEPEQCPEEEIDRLIEVFWATDELLEMYSVISVFVEVDDENERWAVSQTRDTFGWDEASSRKIMFRANRGVGFEFLEARVRTMPFEPYTVLLTVNSLYSEWLTPEVPVIITWDDWMVSPYRFIGVWYHEPPDHWSERVYEINVQDGELSLVPVDDLFSVLRDHFEHDYLFAWGGEESPVRGAESPVTQIVGLFDDPRLELKSISVSVPCTWTLSWALMHNMPDEEDAEDTYTDDVEDAEGEEDAEGTENIEATIERAEEIEAELLSRFADYFVVHDYPIWSENEEITLLLSEETAQLVHYLLATATAFEELEPRHTGHPLHGGPILFIRIEFADGPNMVVYVCAAAAGRFLRTTGTYTWHGDPGVIHAQINELYDLLLSYFMNMDVDED